MMKNITKFVNADQTLTIAAVQGKKGFNVKASVKTGKGKGQPKAMTGARGTFKNAKEAETAFTQLVGEAKKAGWVEAPKTVRNAFTVIPAPVVKAKIAKA